MSGIEEVVISTSKIKKVYFRDRDLVVYIIDSGYVDEHDETFSTHMYHVIEEDAYGKVSISLLNKSGIHGKYLIDVFLDDCGKECKCSDDDLLDSLLLLKNVTDCKVKEQ